MLAEEGGLKQMGEYGEITHVHLGDRIKGDREEENEEERRKESLGKR